MELYKELVNNSRKVICDMVTSKDSNILENRLSFYEDGYLIMQLFPTKDCIYYDDDRFKKRRYTNLVDIFLSNGIDELELEEIVRLVNLKSYSHNTLTCDFVFYFGDLFEVTYLNDYNNDNFVVWMMANEKRVVLSGYSGKMKYRSLTEKTKEVMFGEFYKCRIDNVEEYYDSIECENMVILTDYGCKFKMYADIYRRMCKTKYLNSINFLETGHFFKLQPEDLKRAAKKKLLGIELEIKYIDNGNIVL
ncbi:hypothetical protein [[Clostridium] fimetarium]|uniref:Uncharacterized protein n=1 Tax=[Clostridium] fimetarium TaxID=99656 RepID=A0A1I0RDM5_9FIRM|nr:hypothetical protein [[Clostridium] fimetarium]SEW38841.1 hypothetical protein SAMN05421659_11449 [[Clostridium] fimetarium]